MEQKEHNRLWKARNRQRVKEYNLKYYLEHSEYYKQYRKKYYQNNKDKFRGYDKKRNKTEHRKACCLQWKKEHKEVIRFINKRRKYIKKNAIGNHTLQEWNMLKEKYNFICVSCKKQEPEIKLTADHIVPLSKGGSNYISNIQPLCVSCNSSKHIQTINYLFPSK